MTEDPRSNDANRPALHPIDLVDDVPRTERALRLAVQEALARHKRDGNPVAVWRNDRVEWIQPEDIPVPEELALPGANPR